MALIILHGDLHQFGGPYSLAVKTPGEAVRALCLQIKGFRKRLNDGHFRIVKKTPCCTKSRDLPLDMLRIGIAPWHEIHIVPVVAGSKSGGGKVLTGLAIAAIAFVASPAVVGALGPTMGMATPFATIAGFNITYASVAGLGAALALGGVSQMLSSTKSSSSSSVDTNASYLFSGPVNVTEQGVSIPLGYGEFICGSVVVSSDLETENI